MRLVIPIACLMLLIKPVTAQSVSIENVPLQLIDDVQIASLDPGVVTKLNIQPGDRVEAESILLELDSDIYAAEAGANRMNLRIAQQEATNDVNLRFSQKTLALNDKQLEKSLAAVRQYAKSISETEIDRLRLERDQSELSIEQAELEKATAELNVRLRQQQLDASEIRLTRRSIRSPLHGTVVDLLVQRGEAVTAGQPVIRVVNLDRLRVKATLEAKFAFQVTRDLDAEFEIRLNGKAKTFPAKIVFISPEIRPTEQAFDVWVDIDNTGRELLPGLKGTLKINL
ncbi:MAG: HlyD family efflux transporter periplasmic adaptor subunit [Planctomycetota bacterium]